ncbi:hypothetical protein BVX98_06700 [bacterium F11]|nr:hypothetical protein BVX98_06700 [bacterium F11]
MRKSCLLLSVFLMSYLSCFAMGNKRTPKLFGRIVGNTSWVDHDTGEKFVIEKPWKDGHVFEGILSPDGKSFAIDYGVGPIEKTKRHELRILDVQTKEETKIWENKYPFRYSWSPDSQFVIAAGIGNHFGYVIVHLKSEKIWKIDFKRSIINGYGNPRWSQSGRKVIFIAESNNPQRSNALFEVDLNGMNFKSVVDLPPTTSQEVLSPNEKLIACSRPDDNLWIFDIETKKLTQVAKTRQFESFPFWSPDSQWVGAQMTTNFQGPYDYYLWYLPTGKKRILHIPYSTFTFQWWTPLTEPPVDCVKIVEEMLGEGLPLSELE